jgi:hypothetical protein
MTHDKTRFEVLRPRTLPADVMHLPHVDLALVWLDASPFRDFEDGAHSARNGLLVTFELQPGVEVEALDALMVPDDVLQEIWTGTRSVFGTARLTRSTCARWLTPAGRKVVARFETALVWRDQRGGPHADTMRVTTTPSAGPDAGPSWQTHPSDAIDSTHTTEQPRGDGNRHPISTHDPEESPPAGGDLWIVVDDGCPWARSDLRLPNGRSRLRSLWYQQAPGTIIERAQALPHPWSGGHWDTARLDEWLTRAGHDPAAAYAQWGDDHLLQRTSHGAQVLGLLLGRAGALYKPHEVQPSMASSTQASSDVAAQGPVGSGQTDGPQGPDLVFVQLPRSVRSTVSRAALTPWVLEGIAHGLHCAGRSRRAVVTLSLEAYDGPHDGSSLFEAGVQALIEHARARMQLDLRVVLAAGNAHQRQVTAQLDLASGAPGDICWEVPPGSERAAWLELWCPADTPLPALQVAAPGQALSAPLGVGQLWAWPTCETAVCAVMLPAAPRAGGRLMWVRLAPTQVFQPGEPAAPCGVWRLVLTSAVPVRVHAYLARVWPGPGGKPGGRQGRLWVDHVQPGDLQRQTSWPRPASISGMACGGPDVTVVGGTWAQGDAVGEPEDAGGHVLGPGPAAPSAVAYSGRGPARGGWRAHAPAVDVLAPSEESRCLPGLRSMGHLDGSTPRMGGTSMAVPLHARTLRDDAHQEIPPP